MLSLTKDKYFLVLASQSQSSANWASQPVAIIIGQEHLAREYVRHNIAFDFDKYSLLTIQEILNTDFNIGNLTVHDLRNTDTEDNLPDSDEPQAVS